MSYTDILPPAQDGVFYSINGEGREDFTEMNKGVTPIFFHEAVQNPTKSDAEGRPIYDAEERVRIFVAGDPYNQVTSPVTIEIKARFATQYEAWKTKQLDRMVEGTPIRQWPLLRSEQVAELEAINVFSVENLAAIADSNLNRSPSLRSLRDKAVAWLATAKDSAMATRYAEENAQLRSDLGEAQKQIADLASRVEALAKKKA